MSKKATIIAVVNQKGGTGKTTTTENLGVGLALEGKKVLLVDTDPQASLTVSLGNPCPDDLSPTLSDLMGKIMMEKPIAPGEGILHHPEGVDLVPANIELSGMEVALVNAMSRETILRQYLDTVKQNYDYILLDCMPSLGMLTVNALAAADNVLIPVQAAYLPAKGLEQLLGTINKVKRQINPKLKIEGILLTMVDSRTNYSKDISNLIRESYGGKLKVYKTDIPRSVRAEEISAEGTSIFQHDPKGKVADAYRVLTKELVEKYVGRRSLLRLAIALREQYIQEKTDSLHKEYVNSLITSVKKELSVRSSTTAVPDIDLYQILMNQHKVQVFHDVVKMIKKPRVIQAQNLYSYRVVAQSSPFSGALAMQKVSRSKTVFSDAFKEYNDPYKFLQVLKGKDIPASEYYKYFVNITYEVFNQYGSPASGGERSEYNLLQELSDGVKNSILILDEPESSFDNIFLRDGVDSLLKDISKTIPVIIATHNNTIGVSVHPDYIVYACKEVLSDGKLEYHLYSGYPSSEDLVDLKGNHISRKSVLLDCLEAGEAAYMDRRNSYEILNG